MQKKYSFAERLAKRLKETRKAKGLSLEATANLSGVSRSMLSQIERGDSSPTVATLWNLTRALQVDFAGLLDDNSTESNIREILRARQTPTIEIRGEGCRIRILSPPDQAGRVEVYEIWFSEDGTLISDPHRQGCVEHLTVLEGTLHVTAGEDAAELSRDDTLRYCADCSHAIRAVGGPARALLIVHNS
ncbi:MAG: helix-turn-helix domain-containing protein [Alphaproteobacteria bacterium]|nr:helix-turn-helix domain-containing protein [Alphaproteobacteria bacterium]